MQGKHIGAIRERPERGWSGRCVNRPLSGEPERRRAADETDGPFLPIGSGASRGASTLALTPEKDVPLHAAESVAGEDSRPSGSRPT